MCFGNKFPKAETPTPKADTGIASVGLGETASEPSITLTLTVTQTKILAAFVSLAGAILSGLPPAIQIITSTNAAKLANENEREANALLDTLSRALDDAGLPAPSDTEIESFAETFGVRV